LWHGWCHPPPPLGTVPEMNAKLLRFGVSGSIQAFRPHLSQRALRRCMDRCIHPPPLPPLLMVIGQFWGCFWESGLFRLIPICRARKVENNVEFCQVSEGGASPRVDSHLSPIFLSWVLILNWPRCRKRGSKERWSMPSVKYAA